MKQKIKILSIFLLTFFMGVSSAQAELTIAPLSVEMANRNRTAEVHLMNTSNTTNTYRVEWRYMKMKEDGQYEALETSLTDFDIGKSIRVAPRQVTLRPGEKQTVRLSLSRPPELADGDYRAHLLFQSIGETGPSSRGSGGVTIGAKANLGFAVPVLYRVGELDARVKFEKVDFGQGENGRFMLVHLTRTGLSGTTGEFEIKRINPRDGVKKIRNRALVNMFAEVNQRTFKVLLPDDVYSGDTLRIIYRNPKMDMVFSQAEITVP